MVKNTPCHIPNTQEKIPLAKFLIFRTGKKALPLNVISKSKNFPFAQKEHFLGKLPNISITFVCFFQHVNLFHKKSLEKIMRCKTA